VRVLVIDDEPDILLLCRVNLGFAGHEVLEAPDGERGMELAMRDRPDLIVLDVMLPTLDGLSILRMLRERPETSETPVILLTARAQLDDQTRGWEAGCAEYVTKPFSPVELAGIVARAREMTPQDRRLRRDQALADLARASNL
jgi:DNA-binding response OmpR family regulator